MSSMRLFPRLWWSRVWDSTLEVYHCGHHCHHLCHHHHQGGVGWGSPSPRHQSHHQTVVIIVIIFVIIVVIVIRANVALVIGVLPS